MQKKEKRFRPKSLKFICGSLLLCTALLLLSINGTLAQDEDVAPKVIAYRVVEVKPAETLSEIAKQHGVSMAAIMALNEISEPDSLYSGQLLKIPAVISTPVAAPALPEPMVDQAGEIQPMLPATSHTIKRGETLSEIAKSYGVGLDELMAFNGIDDPDSIYFGQTLQLSPQMRGEDIEEPTPVITATVGLATVVPTTIAPTVEPTLVKPTLLEPQVTFVAVTPTISVTIAVEATPTVEEMAPIVVVTRTDLATNLNQQYTIQMGDTIDSVARQYGADADVIRRLNQVEDPLEPGTLLTLPATRANLVPSEPESVQTHEVQAGEILGFVAKDYNVTLADLLAANYITDPDSIYVGQKLVIPEPESDVPESDVPESDVVEVEIVPPKLGPERSGFYTYEVKRGDTISELARDFNSTILALLSYNNLPDEETLYVGLELKIPFGASVLPQRLPPTPRSGTDFLVSLSRQQCWVLQGDRVAHEWTCSTGYGQWTTRTGSFAVQTKIESAPSSTYQLDMPYWLGIYDVGDFENGIHGLPVRWQTGEKIWTTLIGQPATFGCAMLADDDAAQLFELAYLGMPVHIIQ